MGSYVINYIVLNIQKLQEAIPVIICYDKNIFVIGHAI